MNTRSLAPTVAAMLCLSLPLARAAEDARVTYANKILSDYQAGAPRNHRVLHVAYFTPADRTPAPGYQERLDRVLEDISGFYATQLRQYGLHSVGIPFNKDADGKIIIHLVTGSKPAAEYSEAKSAGEIFQDVEKVLTAKGIGPQTNHVVVFTRLGSYDGTNTSHNSPYCGRGDSNNGFCWQFDSDILDTRLLAETNSRVKDRQYGHIGIGKYNSIFIGGTAHELGHLFGLPHNATTAADLKGPGHSLMGDGNRHYGGELRGEKGTYIPLVDALRIASNPVFSQVDKGLDRRWTSAITNCQLDATTPGRLKISGHFTASEPVYGVVAYANPNLDDDHDAVACAGSIGPGDTFTIDFDAVPRPRKTADLRIILLTASGQHLSAFSGTRAQFRARYTVETDGRINIDGDGKK